MADLDDDKTPNQEPDETERTSAPDLEQEDAQSDDGSAARVAKALGVGEGDGEEAGSDEEISEEEAANRASRRREEAVARRRKKRASAKAEDDLPKDKNARAKELLKRRREQGSAKKPQHRSEPADVALARTADRTAGWVKNNLPTVAIIAGAALIGGLSFAGYSMMSNNKAMAASVLLGEAVTIEDGKVLPEDTRSAEEKQLDPARIFKSTDEQQKAAIAAYDKVIDQYPTSGPGILARLGRANARLDQKSYDGALEDFAAVLKTPLAAADADVRGRSLEGIGFAKEAKKDLDGALTAFTELGTVEAKGFAELSLYHQSRILLAKGDQASRDKAKDLLKQAREKLSVPTFDGRTKRSGFLEAVVDESLRRLDPTAAPPPRTELGGGAKGPTMTKEEIEALVKRAREAQEKKAGEQDNHEGE